MPQGSATIAAVEVGVIGCAHPHAADYLSLLQRYPGVRIAYLQDSDPRRAEAVVARLQSRSIRIEPQILPADATVVLSETADHAADVDRLLALAVPVFVEKPLGIDVQSASRMASTIAASGLPFHTGFFLRQLPVFSRIRDLLAVQALGRIAEVRLRFAHDGLRAGWLAPKHWLCRPDAGSGGGFSDLGIHLVDLASWLGLGPLRPVAAALTRPLGQAEVPEQGVGWLRGGGNASIFVEAGWADAKTAVLEGHILGSRGWVRFGDGHASAGWTGEVGQAVREEVAMDAPSAAAGLEVFLDHLTGRGDAMLVSVDEALSAQRITQSLVDAAEKA